MLLQRGLLASVRATQRLADFQHGGGLHDFFHSGRVVHAGQLHQNLVITQAMFLDHRFADAESQRATTSLQLSVE